MIILSNIQETTVCKRLKTAGKHLSALIFKHLANISWQKSARKNLSIKIPLFDSERYLSLTGVCVHCVICITSPCFFTKVEQTQVGNFSKIEGTKFGPDFQPQPSSPDFTIFLNFFNFPAGWISSQHYLNKVWREAPKKGLTPLKSLKVILKMLLGGIIDQAQFSQFLLPVF